MRWAYGITTVSSRVDSLLPKTLLSLHAAGFPRPHIFADDVKCPITLAAQLSKCSPALMGLQVTTRFPKIRTYGNWVLGLAELYIRNPTAEMYAMFQDDFVTYRNLRQYLERCRYPERGYWNLYTFPSNQAIAPALAGPVVGREHLHADSTGRVIGWYQSRELGDGAVYHGKKQQSGRGAVALVFDRRAVVTLLTHQHMVERPMDVHHGWRRIDGGIVTAMNKAGYREYVHNPSLTQHIGRVSSMGNVPHKSAISFRGEAFDALELLERR